VSVTSLLRASSRGYLNPDPALRKSCTAPLESAHLFVIFSNGERTGIDDLAALTARVFREFCPHQ